MPKREKISIAGLVLVWMACGPGRDDWPDGRPRIDDLTYLQQSPQDPLAFEFLIEFTDTDGDLGEGRLVLRVDGDDAARLVLRDVFSAQSPPIALDSVDGDFQVVARIGRAVDVGEHVELGFRLEDRVGRRSNEASVVLEAVQGGD